MALDLDFAFFLLDWEWQAPEPKKPPFSLLFFLIYWLNWFGFWFLYFSICYILLLLLYNFLKNLIKARPYRWPLRLVQWLFGHLRAAALGTPRTLRRCFFFLGRFFLRLCFWGRRLLFYFQGSYFEIMDFWHHFDFAASFRSDLLLPALWGTMKALVCGLARHFFGHGKHLFFSALGFCVRPWERPWTFIGFLKHLIGWAFGFTVLFYLFLWISYFVYFLCDSFFLILEIFCLHFLRPVFFNEEDHWERFEALYAEVISPVRVLILDVLFDEIPSLVKAIKDRLTSRRLWVDRILWGLLRAMVVALDRVLFRCFIFIRFTAYFQTRRFFRKLWWLLRFSRFYYLRKRAKVRAFVRSVNYSRKRIRSKASIRWRWFSHFLVVLRYDLRWVAFLSRKYLLGRPWFILRLRLRRRALPLGFYLRLGLCWLAFFASLAILVFYCLLLLFWLGLLVSGAWTFLVLLLASSFWP